MTYMWKHLGESRAFLQTLNSACSVKFLSTTSSPKFEVKTSREFNPEALSTEPKYAKFLIFFLCMLHFMISMYQRLNH